MKVTAGKVRVEDKQRLEQEQQSEEKRLAIMMMKKREKYLYKKIMFGKKRKIREVQRLGPHLHPGLGSSQTHSLLPLLPGPGEGVEVPPSVPRLLHGRPELPVPPRGCSPYPILILVLWWDRGSAAPVLL